MTRTLTRTVSLPTYVMKGSSMEKALDTYHLILAPMFACNIAEADELPGEPR